MVRADRVKAVPGDHIEPEFTHVDNVPACEIGDAGNRLVEADCGEPGVAMTMEADPDAAKTVDAADHPVVTEDNMNEEDLWKSGAELLKSGSELLRRLDSELAKDSASQRAWLHRWRVW